MKNRLPKDLLLLDLLVLVIIIVVMLLPSGGLRIALGVPFLLFLPGYALVAALLPRRGRIDAIERIALSFGISIIIVPLTGLVLNYTHLGIDVEPVLFSVSIFIAAASTIAWWRRNRLPEDERFNIEFQFRLPGRCTGMTEKVLSVVLVISILGMLGVAGYAIATPRADDKFTEFYILGPAGKAADYPRELRVGEAGRVVAGIVNHEHREISYRIEIRMSGELLEKLGPVTLENQQKWEQEISFVPDRAGDNQELEFLLYKNGEAEASDNTLHLWLDVKDQ